MSQTNFLIGRGELLTHDIPAPKRVPKKAEVYSLDYAQGRLGPQFTQTSKALDALPQDACPQDLAVARLTLNPAYIAKSFFPASLLRATGLASVGSRTVKVNPEKWSKKTKPTTCTTTELFVAGKRSIFRHMNNWMKGLEEKTGEALDLAHIEKFSSFTPTERLKLYGDKKEHFFEVGVHLLPGQDSAFIRTGFSLYAKKLDINVHKDLSFEAGNLWFVPVEGDKENIEKLSEYAFVRVIRPVPRLRGIRPLTRASSASIACDLPTEQPLSSLPKVAILDGGLPKQHTINPWLGSYRELDPDAEDDNDGIEHGLAVTSAFLFGSITPGTTARRPFSYVDHLRVLDKNADLENPLELYRTLGFVEEVLLSRQYQFINLSLGPDLPIEDTDVHAWTSVIDDLLSDGDTFMTVAIGNNGELDRDSGNARIQVPSDCVNAVAVGAANDTDNAWARATYSAFGPGRSPGVIKPDLMAFGGSPTKYFHALAPGNKSTVSPMLGTSFAAPHLLRNAVGIKSILGNGLSTLAIKALLVHSADPSKHHKHEVGWGKIPEDLMTVITCPAGTARIIYQGELKPGKYLRATLPLPKEGLEGRVKLKATFCYASPVDPQDAAAYTQAGLDVVFRPHSEKVKPGKKNANTKGFFDLKKYATEAERRADLGKWETVLHGSKRVLGSSLSGSVFDIHYNARAAGGKATSAEKIRYALVITVEAPKHANLYNDILNAYAKILTPIQPQVTLPIRV